MKNSLRIGIGQLNPTVGNLTGNRKLILDIASQAEQENCDLLLFPELTLTGYPPEDLVLKPAFIDDNINSLKKLAPQFRRFPVVLGFIDQQNGKRFNAAAWIEKGKVRRIYHKFCLPNYGVFDENRYFSSGLSPVVSSVNGIRFGITICEDIWLRGPHLDSLKKLKPHIILNLSASPFHTGKLPTRHKTIKKVVQALKTPLIYCNMVGGQDELVFDGGSFALSEKGAVVGQCPLFEEGLYVISVTRNKNKMRLRPTWSPPEPITNVDQIHKALVLGIKDYVNKNGFKKAALGVSGGIDSAVVAALAVQALGPENVICVTLPSRFNLSETRKDAIRLAKNLNTRLIEISIQSIFNEFLGSLGSVFDGLPSNVAEENLQARIRGSLLMALSNKFGWLILTTGNKSELSTGYCTLYGDTAGGFSVLKDVLKTSVYKLARRINERSKENLIPDSILQRPPTAELRENQKDEDSLGPYEELDPIISGYVEENKSVRQLSRGGIGKENYVQKVISLIDRNEYKRRQAPLGIKITERSFGRDHRMPITNKYKPN